MVIYLGKNLTNVTETVPLPTGLMPMLNNYSQGFTGVHENPLSKEAILPKGQLFVFPACLCDDFGSLSTLESKQETFLVVQLDGFRWRVSSCGRWFWKPSETSCVHINVYGGRKTEEEKHSGVSHDSQAEPSK